MHGNLREAITARQHKFRTIPSARNLEDIASLRVAELEEKAASCSTLANIAPAEDSVSLRYVKDATSSGAPPAIAGWCLQTKRAS